VGGRKNRDPEKKVFSITARGRDALERWFKVNEPPNHQQDETDLKIVLSLATGIADSGKVIARERAMLYTELHRATARRSDVDPGREMFLILLLEKTIMHLEADLRWLDMLEGRPDEIRKQPVPEPELRPRGRARKTAQSLIEISGKDAE
jgi:hypothetical protein